MLKLRLQRRGKRNYATYRVVVAEHTAPIKGRFIADVGFYNPHTNTFKVDAAKATQWLNQGAKASPTVHNLLIQHGVMKGDKVTSWRPKKKADQAAEASSAPPSPPSEMPADEQKPAGAPETSAPA